MKELDERDELLRSTRGEVLTLQKVVEKLTTEKAHNLTNFSQRMSCKDEQIRDLTEALRLANIDKDVLLTENESYRGELEKRDLFEAAAKEEHETAVGAYEDRLQNCQRELHSARALNFTLQVTRPMSFAKTFVIEIRIKEKQ